MASISNNFNKVNFDQSTMESFSSSEKEKLATIFYKSISVNLRHELKLPGSTDALGMRVFIICSGYKKNVLDENEHPTYVPKHEKGPVGYSKVYEGCDIEIQNTPDLKTDGKKGCYFYPSKSDDPAYPHFCTIDSRLKPKNTKNFTVLPPSPTPEEGNKNSG